MTFQDRGSIKWSSLMLPEHRERLSDWYKEQDNIAKPQLDEQKKEEMNRLLAEAVAENQKVRVTCHKNHHLHQVTGFIKKPDPVKRAFQMIDDSGETSWISLDDVIEAERTE
ncbi:MAG TPA: YolD-like family protein [Bacillales bacterium]